MTASPYRNVYFPVLQDFDGTDNGVRVLRSVLPSMVVNGSLRRRILGRHCRRLVSVCTQLKSRPPTRRFRISCKGNPGENRGLSVVCKPTHAKANVARKQEAVAGRNAGRGRDLGIHILIANSEDEKGGLSVVFKPTQCRETGVGGDRAKRVRGYGGRRRGTGGRRLAARPRHLANVTTNPVPQWTESMGPVTSELLTATF